MAAVDTKAVFTKRVEELELNGLAARFDAAGWTTMGKFAFAPGITNGAPADEKFKEMVLDVLLADPAVPEETQAIPAIRRLWFEAYTITVAAMRRDVERTDDDAPRKVPKAEKEERKRMLKARLGTAFKMEGETEPADILIDRFTSLADDGNLEWVPWTECPKRDQELTANKGKKRWLADNTGVIREREIKDELKAETESLIKVSWALQRRGLALDLAGLMKYEIHETIREKYLGVLTSDPIDPRFGTPSVNQVMCAGLNFYTRVPIAAVS